MVGECHAGTAQCSPRVRPDLARALTIDAKFASLGLGPVDATVAAVCRATAGVSGAHDAPPDDSPRAETAQPCAMRSVVGAD